MSSPRRRSLIPQSIAGRMALCLLLVALVPCAFLTVANDRTFRNSLLQAELHNLRVVHSARTAKIEAYARERIQTTTTLSRTPFIIEAASQLSQHGQNRNETGNLATIAEATRRSARAMSDALDATDLILLSLEGEVLFAANEVIDWERQGNVALRRNTPLARTFENVTTLLAPEISGFALYNGVTRPQAFVAAPILNGKGSLVGIGALQIDDSFLAEIITDYAGLGRTGEIVVGQLEGQRDTTSGPIRILSPFRLDKDATRGLTIDEETLSGNDRQRRNVPIGSKRALPMQQAIAARRGSGIDWDHRGEEVLAVWGYLPSLQWGLVVKQDASEAFGLLNQQRFYALLLLALTLIGAVAVAAYASNRIGRPISSLADALSRLARGDASETEPRHEHGSNLLEVQHIGDSYDRLVASYKDIESFAQAVAAGKFDETITPRSDHDRLALALQEMSRARQQAEAAFEEANQQLEHELAVAQELSNAANREHEAMLLGESSAARILRDDIASCANTDQPQLLIGPTGIGHEAVARAIHRASPRANRPFIYVDVTTAGTGDESLFGRQIATSGEETPGKASLADGGTLYLQGIDRMSPTAQANLLTLLRDTGTVHASRKPEIPDVRIIAYTSVDLSEKSRRGEFDAELAQIMSSQRLAIPTLGQRREDVIPIAERIVTIRSRSLGKVLDGLTDESRDRLINYSWPGDTEELQNVLERAVVLARGTRLDIPEELLHEGPKLGGYTLVRQLGSGAMGDVWLAKHALLSRPAAVKLIGKKALEVDREKQEIIRARFQREAQATAQLRSPHTVELYDFGVSDEGDFYYVMEFLKGIDLQTLVEKHGALPASRVIYLLRQACLSLVEAHDLGLVHRDIKPANLFACELGSEQDFLKVLDFGVVRLTSKQDQLMTATGQITGTPASMAPELLEGIEANPSADIYGLGCVAYWLLTGRPVFEAPSLMALLMQHTNEIPSPPSNHNPAIPGELEAIVLRCLEKKPEDRVTSAQELRNQLGTVSLGRPWCEKDAARWWNENMPGGVDESYADTVDCVINSQHFDTTPNDK